MSRRHRPLLQRDGLALGLFSPNISSGIIPTAVPERWEASWRGNVDLARAAEIAGLDFILSGARWKGYGGATDFQRWTLEGLAWACGILALTERLTILSTVHVPLVHPLYAAKQMATADHIGEGRFGVNLVCGWNQDEFDMFGLEQREHDERYEYGQEWLDVVRRVWSSDDRFDHDGRWFHLVAAIGDPKPWGAGDPVLVNAGGSTAGRAFAARNCDFLFTVIVTLERAERELAEFAELTASYGREVAPMTAAYVVCRPTRAEAEAYHCRYAHELADWPAVDRLMGLMGVHAQSFPPEYFAEYRQRFAAGGGTYPVVGDPDDVAAELARIAATGFEAVALAFVNYAEELPLFRNEVLPRLDALGVR